MPVLFFQDRKKSKELDSNLNLPLFDIVLPWLPEKIKFFLRFGYKYNGCPIIASV